MKRTVNIAAVSLWVNRLVIAAMTVLLFTVPSIIRWYSAIRIELTETECTVIAVAFYCCAAFIFYALWNVEQLLGCILLGAVFTRSNVKRIRRIQWCCGIVSLICLPASFAYMPLVFLVVIMAFLSLMVSVVTSVMDAAVTIREENDLTI